MVVLMRLYQLEDWSTSFKAYAIFGQKDESFVEVCTNRFDDDTKNSFIELYTKVDVLLLNRLLNSRDKQISILK